MILALVLEFQLVSPASKSSDLPVGPTMSVRIPLSDVDVVNFEIAWFPGTGAARRSSVIECNYTFTLRTRKDDIGCR